MMVNTAKNLGIGKGFRLYCCFILLLHLAVVKFFTFISLQARIKAKPLIRMTYSNGYKSRYHQQLQQQQQQQQQAQVCNSPTRGVNCLSVCLEGGMESMHLLINADFISHFIVLCLGRYEYSCWGVHTILTPAYNVCAMIYYVQNGIYMINM